MGPSAFSQLSDAHGTEHGCRHKGQGTGAVSFVFISVFIESFYGAVRRNYSSLHSCVYILHSYSPHTDAIGDRGIRDFGIAGPRRPTQS